MGFKSRHYLAVEWKNISLSIMKSIILFSALMAMASAAPEADADPGVLYNSFYHHHHHRLNPFHYRGYAYGLPHALHRHHLAPYSFYGYPNSLAAAYYGGLAPRLYRRDADSESSAYFGNYFGLPHYGYNHGYLNPYYGHHPAVERISPYHGYHALFHGPYAYPFGTLFHHHPAHARHHPALLY